MSSFIARSSRYVCVIAIAAICVAPSRAHGEEAPFESRTVTYKTVGDIKIEADVYRAADEQVRPVVVWIHGGALIMGSRKNPPKNVRELCRKEGAALVSIDYRLAPETKLPAIIEDVRDAFRWIGGEGARQFHLDPRHLVVAGDSAGGYLTMMTGFCVDPHPTALVSYWGFGDIDGEWQTKPSENYRNPGPLISEERARSVVGERVLTDSNQAGKNRGQFFVYCRQNGIWPNEVTGLDPAREPEKFVPFNPIRHLSAEYPPLLMVHGKADTDVPFDKSVEMAEAMTKLNLPHELILIDKAGHGLGGGDKREVNEAYRRSLEFIAKHLK